MVRKGCLFPFYRILNFLSSLVSLVDQIESVGEDVEVMRTVYQWQFYLHAVAVGVGGHRERYFLETRTGRTENPWLRM